MRGDIVLRLSSPHGIAPEVIYITTLTSRAWTQGTGESYPASSLKRCEDRMSPFTATACKTRPFCKVDDLVRGMMAMMNGPDAVTDS